MLIQSLILVDIGCTSMVVCGCRFKVIMKKGFKNLHGEDNFGLIVKF